MKPYYTDDYCTIYHGDCSDILPVLKKVDLLLTDPPYGIDVGNQSQGKGGGVAIKNDYGVNEWDKTTPTRDTLDACREHSRHSVIWGGNYFELPPSPCWLLWDKQNGATDFADAEMAWTNFDSSVRIIRFLWSGMLQANMKEKEIRKHPTQKPVPVIRWCIEQAEKKAKCDMQTILDPFMGSGTTLRAAKDLQRQCIGIELDEKYCEIAANRLAQEVLAL